MENTLVMLSSIHIHKNVLFPWQVNDYIYGKCTGFCIEYNGEKFIMTNSHCVSGNKININSFLNSNEEIGFLEYESECFDLAIYKSEICDKLIGLSINNDLPNLGDDLYIYSVQSNNINIDVGIYRSLELIKYNLTKVLSIFIDGTVFPGDSGGPVTDKNGKLIGVIFLGNNTNYLGWCVASPVITSFFMRYEYFKKTNNKLININFSIYTQHLNNQHNIKEYYNLDPTKNKGVLVLGPKMCNNYLFKQKILKKKIFY